MSIDIVGVLEERESDDDKKFINDINENCQQFVYEKSNRFSAAWKFLRENNRRITRDIRGVDFIVAKTFLFMNFPNAYMFALFRAEYSPQNLGYKF